MNPNPSGPRITQRDIARSLGLTQATVSLALQNSPRISEECRKQVQETAEKLGYRPNPNATALAHFMRTARIRPVHTVLALINAWPDPTELRRKEEFGSYWLGASAAADKLGYRLEEFVCDRKVGLCKMEKILRARGINGILLPPHPPSVSWEGFDWSHFSVVQLGRSPRSLPLHLVAPSQVLNAGLAFGTMREYGYERIGLVLPAGNKHLFLDAGYLCAQQEVPESERLPICTLAEGKSGVRENQLEFWLKKHRPDAILTQIADAPDLLARIGYGDIGVAGNSVREGSAMAGIDQNREEIGRVSVLMLNTMIRDHDCGIPAIPRQNLVMGQWIDGSSLPRRVETRESAK